MHPEGNYDPINQPRGHFIDRWGQTSLAPISEMQYLTNTQNGAYDSFCVVLVESITKKTPLRAQLGRLHRPAERNPFL